MGTFPVEAMLRITKTRGGLVGHLGVFSAVSENEGESFATALLVQKRGVDGVMVGASTTPQGNAQMGQ